MRVNRSIQVEGAFGRIKQNMEFDRFSRRLLNKVSVEFGLVVLDYNVSKAFKYFEGTLSNAHWTLTDETIIETPKKPSIKRVVNIVN